MVDSRNKPFTEPVLRAVAASLRRHAQEGQSVVTGFSGGLDSTVLLHAACRLADDAGLTLLALHVHHGLSASADSWLRFCESLCKEWAVPLAVQRVNVPLGSGEGLEAAARRSRHKVFAGHPADWVLLAHHADDQAETVLHNLLRGAGVRGAAGIPEARGRILRPLLGLARDELQRYAISQGLTWIEDESNADRRYTRNFLRHSVLPLLSARFPRAGEQLAAAARRFNEADSLLNDLATSDLGGHAPAFPLPLTLFRELPDTRARNLLRAMLGWHQLQSPDEPRLNEFVRQLRTAANDRHPRLDLDRYALWCEAGRLFCRISA